MPQANPPAARLAQTMRAAMKSQGLSVPDLVDVIEQQTGVRLNPGLIYKATSDGAWPFLIRISPHLLPLARALDLDPVQLVVDAITPDLNPAEVSP